MNFNIAQLMRVILLQALDYGSFIIRILEELSETVPGLHA
jgi:hypothetical protein